MASTNTHPADHRGVSDSGGRTPAQWFATIGGITLIAAGLLGFIADSTFDTGSDIQGDKLLGLEVNGWHNLVHLASGVFLLALAKKRATAKTASIIFGVTYVVVTIWGLVDGNTVLGLLPVNPADNVLHAVLALAALAAAAASSGDDRDHHGSGSRSGTGDASRTGTSGRFAPGTGETAGQGETVRTGRDRL